MSTIRFATTILSRLGEELNPNIDQGVLELAKNSYDADARHFTIELRDAASPGGSVLVTDDGRGMSPAEIENGWLVLGASEKDSRTLTKLGRRPSGSKGLGRLAALRMGDYVRLISRPENTPEAEHQLDIDWSKFAAVQTVDEVELAISSRGRGEDVSPGTEIEVRGLRHAVGRNQMKRLARALVLLADPFGDSSSGFAPILKAPEFEDIARFVEQRYFDQSDYHLIGLLDQEGNAKAEVVDWKGAQLYAATHEELAAKRQGEKYRTPPCRFDLWAFLLNQTTFAPKQATVGEVREWLQAFGGVHVYQNGIRVTPYGNPGEDWLEMNLRRAQSPEERPSTNNSIGRVSIDDAHSRLTQKTDRSGFVETQDFEELKNFAKDCLEWMSRRRLEAAEKRRSEERAAAKTSSERSRESVEKVIEESASAEKPKLQRAFRAYDKSREREVNQLRKEVQLYRTLSTVGITTATFAHESHNNPIKVISSGLETIARRAKAIAGSQYEERLKPPIETVRRSTDTLSALGSTALKLVDHGKRRHGRVDLNRVLGGVVETFEPFLRGRDVSLQEHFQAGEIYLYGTEAAVESIITNLLNNAVTAFEDMVSSERYIAVTTRSEDAERVRIIVEDNGPGVQGINPRDIWLPGQTTRANGTGLGLTIVRDTVYDLGGKVGAEQSEDLGGAMFIIDLPIIGKAT